MATHEKILNIESVFPVCKLAAFSSRIALENARSLAVIDLQQCLEGLFDFSLSKLELLILEDLMIQLGFSPVDVESVPRTQRTSAQIVPQFVQGHMEDLG